MWLADAETSTLTPKKAASETTKRPWTNVSAAPFVPSRPQPPTQGSHGVDKSEKCAATASQPHTPGLAKGEGSKLSDKAAVFHPAAKSPTQHNSRESPQIAAARVRSPIKHVNLLGSAAPVFFLRGHVGSGASALDVHIYLHQICTSCAYIEAMSQDQQHQVNTIPGVETLLAVKCSCLRSKVLLYDSSICMIRLWECSCKLLLQSNWSSIVPHSCNELFVPGHIYLNGAFTFYCRTLQAAIQQETSSIPPDPLTRPGTPPPPPPTPPGPPPTRPTPPPTHPPLPHMPPPLPPTPPPAWPPAQPLRLSPPLLSC